MKIVFFGTPFFAAKCLETIIKKHNIIAVVTGLDKIKGRGKKIKISEIKKTAIENNIKLYQQEDLKEKDFINKIKNIEADLFVVVAFKKIPKEIWSIPSKGTINLHASLLPDYRGAAPINWAIMNGENKTGITTFFINEKIDCGDIILKKEINIDKKTTAAKLHKEMIEKGSKLLIETIIKIEKNETKTIDQNDELNQKKAPKLTKEICRIKWDEDCEKIHNKIRGLSPIINEFETEKDISIFPGAWSIIKNNQKEIKVKIYESEYKLQKHNLCFGSIVTDNKKELKISSKRGFLIIKKIQIESKKIMDIKSFLNGNKIEEKSKFI